ncbi:MAG: alpha-galactosidase, partial [Myxococcales bacterium]|nr:alpha-galactosidase [Myxococcales bacterium]
DLILRLSVYAGRPFVTISLHARDAGAESLLIERLVPAKIEAASGGALLLGENPRRHRILESGSFFLADFFVDVVPGDVRRPVEATLLQALHGEQRGSSVSNWSHAIKDLDSGETFVAGSLDFELSSPMCNTSFSSASAGAPIEGRTPFSYWSIEMPYLPQGKRIEPGESLRAGPILILPGGPAHPSLETYAEALAQYTGVELWPERGEDHRVPTGWNSWTGSSGAGGYGQAIDEALMLQNLEVMATELAPFGVEWFQIDDGYQLARGDWDFRADTFPSGSRWIAEQIQARGLHPGLWIAPLQVEESSMLYAAHRADGWLLETDPILDGGYPVLDPSHPEVLAWLRDRMRRIRADGNRWVKTDFMYYALGGTRYYEPNLTREEAYGLAMRAIREGLDQGAVEAGGRPGDTFWLSVSMIGPHIGLADSLRMNLDTMPVWESVDPGGDRRAAQGFKPTVRTIARRYFLQGRVFTFNHDMILFRSHPDSSLPRVTRDESRALASAIALSGSVTKLGERLAEMPPEWIEDYRRLVPVFGRGARPMDLFEREFPEIWHLRIVPSEGFRTAGDGAPYDVIALFHWGENRDLTTEPYAAMPDVPRAIEIPLADLGLDPELRYTAREFWSGEILEGVQGTLRRDVPPHSVEVFALRPELAHPSYLGGNRHLLQGAVEISSERWDEASRTLSLRYDAPSGSATLPFEHRLLFRIPPGHALLDASVPSARAGSVLTERVGSQLELRFFVDASADALIELHFAP